MARVLHQRTGLPLIHLDQEYYYPGWQEPTKAKWVEKMQLLLSRDRWIIDGNYGGTMVQRIAKADTIIFLDRSRWTCLYRVLKRVIIHHGQVRPDSAPGCPERFDWDFIKYVYRFQKDKKPTLLKHLAQVDKEKEVIVLRSNREVRGFLDQVKVANQAC